jgi:hypothetical protein
VAAARNAIAARVLPTLFLASGLYLFALLCGYYLDLGSVRRHHLEAASFILIALLLAAVFSRRGDDTVDESAGRHALRRLSLVPLLACVGAAPYATVVTAGLFADDYVLLDAARQGRLTVWSDLFRPAIFTVWRPVAALVADAAPILHAINITLHVVNGLLVYALARRLRLPAWTAGWAGVLFLSFPAAVEAVAWPSGLQDVLMTTFVLGFLVVVMHPNGTWQRAAGALTLLIGALLTKETAVAAPALAALLCLVLRPGRATWALIGGSGCVVAVFLTVRFAFLPLPRGFGMPLTSYTIKERIVRPFASLVVPLRESEAADAPWVALFFSAVVVVALVAAAARWHRRHVDFVLVLAAAGFVLVSVAPVHGYFHITADLHGSRYLYLGSAGWVILLVALFRTSFPERGLLGPALVFAVSLSWTYFAVRHGLLWRDAGAVRDRIISAAVRAPLDHCGSWGVYGLPAVINGVPTFVNGFPEAMRAIGRTERFRIAPDTLEPGECLLRWTGTEWTIGDR